MFFLKDKSIIDDLQYQIKELNGRLDSEHKRFMIMVRRFNKLEDFVKKNDPEYQKYLELKKKFEENF